MIHNLTITKFEEEDFDNYFTLVSNAEVMLQIIGRPHTLEEAKEKFAQELHNNQLHPLCGTFKVVNEDLGGAFVGFVKLEIETADSTEAEIGYMLLPEYWGKGYGNQVAIHVIELAKKVEQLTKLTANIDPENEASKKILVNHGFITQRFYTWHGLPAEWLTRDI